MNREQITQILLQRADALKANGATSLYMFGSRARGDNKFNSDLDLFIDYDASKKIPNYFKLIGIQLEIENETGFPVDLGTRDSLDPIVRPFVDRDAIKIF